jgi:hypothetical protein
LKEEEKMTLQTKEQTIGYIIRAALGTSIPAKKIHDIGEAAIEKIDNRSDISNDDALDFAENITDGILNEEEKKELRSEIYYTFDLKTVNEAAELYKGFIMLYPHLAQIR